MPSEQHEAYIEKAVAKLRSEGWVCETQYRYDNHIFDIFAYNPRTKDTKVIEVQMGGQPKPQLGSLPFQVEYIFPEKPKSSREIESVARKILSALSSPTRINMTLAMEELPRSYIELYPFVGVSKGLIAYHLRKLVRGGLIKRVGGKYEVTDLGKNILSFLRTAETNGSLMKAQEWTRNTDTKRERKPLAITKKHIAPKSDKLHELLLGNPPETFTYNDLAMKIGSSNNGTRSLVSSLALSHLVKTTSVPTISEEEIMESEIRRLLLQNPRDTFTCTQLAEKIGVGRDIVASILAEINLNYLVRVESTIC